MKSTVTNGNEETGIAQNARKAASPIFKYLTVKYAFITVASILISRL